MVNRWMCSICYISVEDKYINRHLKSDTHKILSNDLSNLSFNYSCESINYMKQEKDQRKADPTIHERDIIFKQNKQKIYNEKHKKEQINNLTILQATQNKNSQMYFL